MCWLYLVQKLNSYSDLNCSYSVQDLDTLQRQHNTEYEVDRIIACFWAYRWNHFSVALHTVFSGKTAFEQSYVMKKNGRGAKISTEVDVVLEARRLNTVLALLLKQTVGEKQQMHLVMQTWLLPKDPAFFWASRDICHLRIPMRNDEAKKENEVWQRLVVAGGKTCKRVLQRHWALICCSNFFHFFNCGGVFFAYFCG